MYTVKFFSGTKDPSFTLTAASDECLNGIIAAHAVMQNSWGLEYIDEIDPFEVYDISGNRLTKDDLKRIWSGYTPNGPSDYLPGEVWVPEDGIQIMGTMTPTKKPIVRYIIVEPVNMILGEIGYVLNYDTDQFWQCFVNTASSMKTRLIGPRSGRIIYKDVQIYDYKNDYTSFKRAFAKLHELSWV